MRIDVITLFPAVFSGPFNESIVGRAQEQGLVEINLINLRDFARDRRGTVDDAPFGGGAGMLLRPDVLADAIESVRGIDSLVLLMSPQGQPFSQPMAAGLAERCHLIIVCGHYEGVDERIRQVLIDKEISIGDYVLTSGNLAAMVVCDAVVRLLPGSLGSAESAMFDSFSDQQLLEYPHYTRPAEFRGMRVPEELLSGDHGKVEAWRRRQSLLRTIGRRPDLI